MSTKFPVSTSEELTSTESLLDRLAFSERSSGGVNDTNCPTCTSGFDSLFSWYMASKLSCSFFLPATCRL